METSKAFAGSMRIGTQKAALLGYSLSTYAGPFCDHRCLCLSASCCRNYCLAAAHDFPIAPPGIAFGSQRCPNFSRFLAGMGDVSEGKFAGVMKKTLAHHHLRSGQWHRATLGSQLADASRSRIHYCQRPQSQNDRNVLLRGSASRSILSSSWSLWCCHYSLL